MHTHTHTHTHSREIPHTNTQTSDEPHRQPVLPCPWHLLQPSYVASSPTHRASQRLPPVTHCRRGAACYRVSARQLLPPHILRPAPPRPAPPSPASCSSATRSESRVAQLRPRRVRLKFRCPGRPVVPDTAPHPPPFPPPRRTLRFFDIVLVADMMPKGFGGRTRREVKKNFFSFCGEKKTLVRGQPQ